MVGSGDDCVWLGARLTGNRSVSTVDGILSKDLARFEVQ